ncbi:MAG: 7-carboxy-7-deazaguanine synthase [Rhodospirillaceae bacterium]|nr:MAG: 7-carboxy-7-deazaguanine synthase [Rhodospirillaceae bacterium]
MAYQVKELFYSLQGEGTNSGRPAVFCRFSGCNLWSGREVDRAEATCNFCDTDFVGGDKFVDADTLAGAIVKFWPTGHDEKFVVLTGGEPGLQVDATLVEALHKQGFEIAIESNGTQDLPDGLDWVCISPKASEPLKITKGDELKLVFPQSEVDPGDYAALDFKHFYLQALDGPYQEKNLLLAMDYCLQHPQWRLSLQTHKLLNIR